MVRRPEGVMDGVNSNEVLLGDVGPPRNSRPY